MEGKRTIAIWLFDGWSWVDGLARIALLVGLITVPWCTKLWLTGGGFAVYHGGESLEEGLRRK